jgi:hypothetical protein
MKRFPIIPCVAGLKPTLDPWLEGLRHSQKHLVVNEVSQFLYQIVGADEVGAEGVTPFLEDPAATIVNIELPEIGALELWT